MIYAILIVLLMITLSFRGITSSMPGGWQPMNVSDNLELLKSLVQFAVNTTDKKHEASPYLIVSAQQQVVAGMKYDVLVKFDPQTEHCVLKEFIIADRFGNRSVLGNETMGKC